MVGIGEVVPTPGSPPSPPPLGLPSPYGFHVPPAYKLSLRDTIGSMSAFHAIDVSSGSWLIG